MQPQRCPYCGHVVQLIFVHSHYQCPACGANLLPCCESEHMEENGDTQAPSKQEQRLPGNEPQHDLPGNNDT